MSNLKLFLICLLILSFVSLIFLSGCTNKEGISKEIKPNINISGKKILMVIAPVNFRDEEFLEPKKVFEDSGASVEVASKDVKEATSMIDKIKVKVDLDIGEVNVTDYDAVVFIGGSGASVYYDDQTALDIARESYKKNKIVAAICIAPGILAKSGILEGKNATIWDPGNGNFIKILKESGATYTGADVEQDGKIITANNPKAATKFGERILENLK